MTGNRMQRGRPAARGQARVAGQMNRLETQYAEQLRMRQMAGEVAWFAFEPMKLRLAHATFYTPDFLVMLADGALEVHETKGFWEEDARVKIKVAASMYPFRFFGVKKDRSNWITEEFKAA